MKANPRYVFVAYLAIFLTATTTIVTTGTFGYELSIYVATPALVWAVVAGAVALGIAILIRCSYQSERGGWFWLGFFMVVSANLLVIYLPSLRGYYYEGNADPIAQVGFTIDTLRNGRVSELNIYPLTHILMATVARILDLQALEIAKLLPGVLYVNYVISMFLLASIMLKRRGPMILGILTSTPLLSRIFLVEIYPHAAAVMTLPLFLYIYFRRFSQKTRNWTGLFLIFILGYSFFHPAVATTILAGMFVLELSKAFLPSLWQAKTRTHGTRNKSIYHRVMGVSFYPCLIIFIVSYDWLSGFQIFDQKLRMITITLFSQPQTNRVVQSINLSQEEFIVYALKAWSDNIIYLCLYAIAFLAFIKFVWSKQSADSPFFKLTLLLLAGDIYGLLFYVVVQAQLPSRAAELTLFTVVGPILCGYALYSLLENRRWRKIKAAALAFTIIFLVSMVSISSLYASPYTYMQNRQVTQTDIAGLKWLLIYKPSNRLYTTLGVVHAYIYFILGFDDANSRNDTLESMSTLYYLRDAVPPHLGYGNETGDASNPQNSLGNYYYQLGEVFETAGARTDAEKQRYDALGQFYMNDVYFVVTYRFVAPHLDPILSSSSISAPEETRWDITLKDLERLKADVTVNRIFSNSHLWINLVHTSKS